MKVGVIAEGACRLAIGAPQGCFHSSGIRQVVLQTAHGGGHLWQRTCHAPYAHLLALS